MSAWEKVKCFFAGFIAGIVGLGAIIAAFWIGRSKSNNPPIDGAKPDIGAGIDQQASNIGQLIDTIGDNEARKRSTQEVLDNSARVRQSAKDFLEKYPD